MAKTNDGTLLQHFVECEAAHLLTREQPDLRLVCTHAMAPFESGETETAAPDAQVLHRVLQAASGGGDTALASWSVVRAYERTNAGTDHYPNTAELMAALVGESHLGGVLCEKDEVHASVLNNRWAPTDVQVRGGNWRNAAAGGHLNAPDEARPWLFTMDPYTWLLTQEANKARRGPCLCRADLEIVRPILGHYANRDVPGMLVVLAYGLDEAHARDFRRSVIGMADRLGLERSFLGIDAGAGTRHMAAVSSPTPGLTAELAEAWTRFRAEVAAV